MASSNGQGLMELADLISRREYNWGIARARAYEEELVKSYADETDTEYTTLADTIEALYEKRIISAKQRENLHNIRILGNKAVHENDNDPQDAKNAYYLLKEEMQAFSQRDQETELRTPVMISRRSDGSGFEPETDEGSYENPEEEEDSETGGIDVSYNTTTGRRSGGNHTQRTSSQRSGNGKKKKKKTGIDPYLIIKIALGLIILILLIILLKSLFHGSKKEKETEAVSIETEMPTEETETEAPETEAAPETTQAPETEAQVSYRITTDGVNIRYADDPGRVYTQLGQGSVIGTVEDYTGNAEYADFAKFTYDGKEVIVSKKYIEAAE